MQFLLLLVLSGPYKYEDPCLDMETLEWRLCQPRVVVIGPWNPLPYDYSPPTTQYPEPPAVGAYKTESRPTSCKYGVE